MSTNVNDIVYDIGSFFLSENSIYDISVNCRLFLNYVKNCPITNTNCIHPLHWYNTVE